MNIKAFFVAALSSALDQGIAKPDDILRHVTPDVLSEHLPRPLWARLLTACVGAPKVDAQLVVETLGVPNLCEHIPSPIIWACLAELGARALGGHIAAAPVARPNATAAEVTKVSEPPRPPAKPLSIGAPPPPEPRPTPPPQPAVAGPSIPPPGKEVPVGIEDVVAELDAEDRSTPPARARTPTGQRFRQTNTNIGRLAQGNQRRPQAAVTAPAPAPEPPASPRPARRGETEIEVEVETDVGGRDDWRTALAVEDEQLVDWSSSEETVTSTSDQSRKR